MTNVLGAAAVEAFKRRKISGETAARYNVYTASQKGGAVVPDPDGKIVVFPFMEHGRAVNEKYRAAGKRFWQKAGGKRTFWNADALDDPALESHVPLTITEGEIDGLTAIEAGFPLTVSVPDGALPVKEGDDPDKVEPADAGSEHSGKFEFLWNNRERLRRVKRFIIATDADAPGRRLAAELVRRLSPARCSFVEYPDGCKDLNDVAVRHDIQAVVQVLNSAKPYPVRGLYHLRDYPDQEPLRPVSTGWWTIDEHMKMFSGELMVVSGIISHGKSSWCLNLLCNLASLHRWRAAVFSPEMRMVPFLRDKLRRVVGGHVEGADSFIDDMFSFIDADPTGPQDDDYTLEWLIDRATDAVLRDGVRVLLIDPWNEVEHARERGESMVDYIGRALRSLKRFARLYDVAVIVVAHPTKEVARDGKARVPTLYDIADSSHFANKCDHGVIIDLPDSDLGETVIHVRKVRFEETGRKGHVRLRYDRATCRYSTLDDSVNQTVEEFK